MLVSALCHAVNATWLGYSLFVAHDWVTSDYFDTGIFIFEIIETYFNMQFAGARYYIFARSFINNTYDQGIGFGKTFETVNKFGHIGWVSWFDGYSHNGRY